MPNSTVMEIIMKYLKGPNELDTSFYYRWHSEALKNNMLGNNMPIHIHQSAELIMVTKGELNISIDGKDTETLHDNQAALILPFSPHMYRAVAGTEYLRCNFAATLVPDFFNMMDNKTGDRAVFDVDPTTVICFQKKILQDNRLSLWSIRTFLHSAIDDYLSQVNLCQSQSNNHILTRAITYMNDHKAEKLTISKVASAIGYSRSHLSFYINKAACFNFNTLLSMLRIEDARVMLKNTQKSILEIAIECGFGSERNFYRQFKALSGISPKDYRKGHVFKTQVEPTGTNIPFSQT